MGKGPAGADRIEGTGDALRVDLLAASGLEADAVKKCPEFEQLQCVVPVLELGVGDEVDHGMGRSEHRVIDAVTVAGPGLGERLAHRKDCAAARVEDTPVKLDLEAA